MSPINLSQSYQNTAGATKKPSAFDKGVVISLSILVITLLIYGGLFLYTKELVNKKNLVNREIEAETLNLTVKDVDRVADFQKRLEVIDKNISSRNDPNDVLKQLSQSMVGGAVAILFQVTENKGKLDFQADNFQIAAKQILNFKKKGNFNDVVVNKINREQDGKVTISVTLGF